MASSRKRWRQQLPSIESLLEDAQQSDESFANLKSGLDVISHTRAMDFGKEKLQSLNEAEKICWVFGKVLVKCRQNVANKLFISRYFNPVVPIHPCVL